VLIVIALVFVLGLLWRVLELFSSLLTEVNKDTSVLLEASSVDGLLFRGNEAVELLDGLCG
jgi:hypothetical protein